jgi:hypothetical protein
MNDIRYFNNTDTDDIDDINPPPLPTPPFQGKKPEIKIKNNKPKSDLLKNKFFRKTNNK